MVLGFAWVTVRAWRPAQPRAAGPGSDRGHGRQRPGRARLAPAAEDRFRLVWIFDGILQAQPKMAVGLPSQVIEPIAASSPPWVQHVVNWAGTNWSYHPMQAGASAVWIQVGLGIWMLAASRGPLSGSPGWSASGGDWWSGCSANPRRDLRPRPDLAVRRTGRSADLRGRGRPDRAARADVAHAAPGPGDPRRDGAVLAGMAVLQRGRAEGSGRAPPAGSRHADRHGPVDGPDTPAALPVGLGERLRLVRRRARVRGQPVRRGRPGGDRRGVPERTAGAYPPGPHRVHGAVPGRLGADRGLRLLRRLGTDPNSMLRWCCWPSPDTSP